MIQLRLLVSPLPSLYISSEVHHISVLSLSRHMDNREVVSTVTVGMSVG